MGDFWRAGGSGCGRAPAVFAFLFRAFWPYARNCTAVLHGVCRFDQPRWSNHGARQADLGRHKNTPATSLSPMASRALSSIRTTSAAARAVRVYSQAPHVQPPHVQLAARTPAHLVQAPEVARAGIWASVARSRPRRLLGHAAPRRFMAAYSGAPPLSAHPCSTHQLLGFQSMNQCSRVTSLPSSPPMHLRLCSASPGFTCLQSIPATSINPISSKWPPLRSPLRVQLCGSTCVSHHTSCIRPAWHVRTNPLKVRLSSRAAQGLQAGEP